MTFGYYWKKPTTTKDRKPRIGVVAARRKETGGTI
jgi:hypothetical protein